MSPEHGLDALSRAIGALESRVADQGKQVDRLMDIIMDDQRIHSGALFDMKEAVTGIHNSLTELTASLQSLTDRVNFGFVAFGHAQPPASGSGAVARPGSVPPRGLVDLACDVPRQLRVVPQPPPHPPHAESERDCPAPPAEVLPHGAGWKRGGALPQRETLSR